VGSLTQLLLVPVVLVRKLRQHLAQEDQTALTQHSLQFLLLVVAVGVLIQQITLTKTAFPEDLVAELVQIV
jgi:hypothetical protein